MKRIQQPRRPKILIKGKVVEVVLQIGRHPRNVVPGMGANGPELERDENKDLLGPVVRHDHCAEDVGQQVREYVLRHGAVRRGDSHGSREFVVLLVKQGVEALGVKRPMDVVEAHLRAEHVEDDGSDGPQWPWQRRRTDWPDLTEVNGERDERQGDEELVAQPNGEDAQVFLPAHANKGLRLVLEQPPRPPGKIGDREHGTPDPEEDRRDNEGAPQVQVVLSVCTLEVVVHTAAIGGRVKQHKRGDENGVGGQGAELRAIAECRCRVQPSLFLRDRFALEVGRNGALRRAVLRCLRRGRRRCARALGLC